MVRPRSFVIAALAAVLLSANLSLAPVRAATEAPLIAFAADYPEKGIWTFDPVTKELTQLAENGFRPTWSPDGQQLAYIDEGDLHVVDMGTGDDTIVGSGLSDGWEATIHWSSDTSRIAVDEGEITVFDLDSLSTVVIGGDQSAWAPTSDLLAVNDRNQIELHAVNGSLVEVLGLGRDPAWSPNDDKLFFAHDNSIEVFDASTGKTSTLGSGSGIYQVSPDGEQLAVSASSSQGSALAFMDSTSGSRTILDVGNPSRLEWSPDSKMIAFTQTDDSDPYANGYGRLYVARETDSRTQLLSHRVRYSSPSERPRTSDISWSPDSQQVIFESSGISAIHFDGTGVKNLIYGNALMPSSPPCFGGSNCSVPSSPGTNASKRKMAFRVRRYIDDWGTKYDWLEGNGTVTASDLFAECEAGVLVKIYRMTNQGWRLVLRTRTDMEGDFSEQLPFKPGRYIAVTPSFTANFVKSHICRHAGKASWWRP